MNVILDINRHHRLLAAAGISRDDESRLDRILRLVCDHYNLHPNSLLNSGRQAGDSLARHVAMAVIRQNCGLSLQVIAELFHRTDHGTVIHACRRIQRLRQGDPDFDTLVANLITATKSPCTTPRRSSPSTSSAC